MTMAVLGFVVLALAALPAATAAINLRVLMATPRLTPRADSLVSILIPARNEEGRIGDAIAAALASRGVPIEILVMDDASTDRTAEIVERWVRTDSRVRLLTAPSLEPGWTGKIHACHHLAQAAGGDYLLFVDADVRLGPDGAAVLAAHADATGAALVSAVPRQITRSLGELLTVPSINLMLLGYLPMGIMRRSDDPGFGAACGQMLLAERRAYRASGGHAAIRHLLHDGIQLARLFRRNGFATDLVLGNDLASCRMYRGFLDAWAGFSKNAHEGIATAKVLPIWSVLLIGGHVVPFAVLPFWPAFPIVAAAGLSLAARAVITIATKEHPLAILLHPFTILVGIAIQWSSLLRFRAGRQAGWKGRLYPVG
jgi:Glycosyl transferase family 2